MKFRHAADVSITCLLVVLGVRIAWAQQLSAGPVGSGTVSTTPPPGAVINSANASTYEHFLPPGADLAIKYGLAMRVVPSRRLDWSAGFTTATEKYSGQVGLDADNDITNYIAGMPFPTVGINDPKAAVKIAYNWHMGPFMPDDFSLEPWGSFAYSVPSLGHSFRKIGTPTRAVAWFSCASRIVPKSIRVRRSAQTKTGSNGKLGAWSGRAVRT
jgi:hypothetical protein